MLRTSAARPGPASVQRSSLLFAEGRHQRVSNTVLSLASGNDRDSELSHLREDPGEVPSFVDFIEAGITACSMN